MIIVDAHCDTASEVLDRNENLYSNSCHADILRMCEKGSWVQFFAAFADPAIYKSKEMQRIKQIIDSIYASAELYKHCMSICRNYEDIKIALEEKKVAAIISVEGGEALQGELSALRMLYGLGVRSICLTWNYRNEIGVGIKDRASGGGLTPFGREVACEMNRLGMLIDVSHLSEEGFWDVLEVTKYPIIASHSNAIAVCSHPRNLSDEQLRAMKVNGGVAGINFYPQFLKNNVSNGEAVYVDDIVRHIEHIVSLTGEDCIGIGADFDGIECTPADITGVQYIDRLFDRLLALNYSESFINKLAGENFINVIKAIIK